MAIYVDLSEDDITGLLSAYELGNLIEFQGITAGVSNTNYFIKTTRDKYILTLFEERRTRAKDLPFIFDWSSHLNAHGLHCPSVIQDENGERFKTIKDKAAVLVNFLDGEDIPRGNTGLNHCYQMGEFTARMHLASDNFEKSRDNDWPLARHRKILEDYRDEINAYNSSLLEIIDDELDFQSSLKYEELPSGVVHTDLFPDNVFFRDNKITAVIDMYFACTHAYIYDLAIVVNAWCFNGQGEFQPQLFNTLKHGYASMRELNAYETQSFQAALRLASLRFLMSRLEEWVTYNPENTLMQPHDPAEYIERLLFHHQHDIMASS